MDKVDPKQETIDAFAEKMEDDSHGEQTDVMDPVEIDYDDFEDSPSLGEMIPTMNVTSVPIVEETPCIVESEKLLGLYEEIVQNCRLDREKVDKIQANFEDMVINEGDATNSSKEALVNLMKIKTDINDKLSKVADLMTRVHLKEKDTFPRYLAAHQHNNVTIETSNKRDILKNLQQQKRKNG